MFGSLLFGGSGGDKHIDLLVAEHVMGWLPTNEEVYPGGAISSNYRARAWKVPGRGLIAEESIPRYSLDLRSSWEIVSLLVFKGFIVDVHAYPEKRRWLKPPHEGAHPTNWTLQPTRPDERFQCAISSSEIPEDLGEWIVRADCEASTVEMAICLSALKVVGHEYKKPGS